MFHRWIELLASLGGAVLELVATELSELSRALAGSGRSLGLALLYLLLAGVFLVMTLALLTVVIVAALAQVWPLWVAALVVAGAWGFAAAAVGGAGWWKLRQIEWPHVTVRRHVGDHVNWWREQIVDESRGREP